MNARIPYRAMPLVLLAVLATGCGTQGKPPPSIALDEPIQAQALPEPPKPIEVVAIPEVLPLPAQLKPLPKGGEAQPAPEPADEKARVARANAEARVAPTREGYVNAIQVWPYSDGALYQVYAAPERVTVIALQAGEELVTVAAGDTVLFRVQVQADGSILLRPLPSQGVNRAGLNVGTGSVPPDAQVPSRLQQLSFRPPDMLALAQLLRPGGLDTLLQGLNPAAPEASSGPRAQARAFGRQTR